jgi:hypothetical protein
MVSRAHSRNLTHRIPFQSILNPSQTLFRLFKSKPMPSLYSFFMLIQQLMKMNLPQYLFMLQKFILNQSQNLNSFNPVNPSLKLFKLSQSNTIQPHVNQEKHLIYTVSIVCPFQLLFQVMMNPFRQLLMLFQSMMNPFKQLLMLYQSMMNPFKQL